MESRSVRVWMTWTMFYDSRVRPSRRVGRSSRLRFSFNGDYAKADILSPVDADAWDIFEVKSSTSVKEVYISDLAFQAFGYAGAGLKVRRCFLLLINKDFVRRGDIEPARCLKTRLPHSHDLRRTSKILGRPHRRATAACRGRGTKTQYRQVTSHPG